MTAALAGLGFAPFVYALVVARCDRRRRLIEAARHPIGDRYWSSTAPDETRAASAGERRSGVPNGRTGVASWAPVRPFPSTRHRSALDA